MRIGQGSLKAPVYRKNKDIIRRYYQDLWNPWDLDTAHELIAPDMEFRGSLGVTVQGIVGFQSYMSTVRAAFPDFHDQVEDMVAEGDQVVARLTYTGTHLGGIFGLAPTGEGYKLWWHSGVSHLRRQGCRGLGDGRPLGAVQTNQRPGRSKPLHLTNPSRIGANGYKSQADTTLVFLVPSSTFVTRCLIQPPRAYNMVPG